jgi:hypothetical protein
MARYLGKVPWQGGTWHFDRPITGSSLRRVCPSDPWPLSAAAPGFNLKFGAGSSMHRQLRFLASVLGPGPQAGAMPRHRGARRWRPNVDRASGLSATAGSLPVSLPPASAAQDPGPATAPAVPTASPTRRAESGHWDLRSKLEGEVASSDRPGP